VGQFSVQLNSLIMLGANRQDRGWSALIGAFVLGRELARSGDDYSAASARYKTRMRP
jgi:hypothetical protein